MNAQYEEWNKRIREASQDNYFNDSATKVVRRKPMNPLNNLTTEGMRDIKTTKNKEPSNISPSINFDQVQTQEYLDLKDLEMKEQDPTTILSSFLNINEDVAPDEEEGIKMKDIMKMEIILIMVS